MIKVVIFLAVFDPPNDYEEVVKKIPPFNVLEDILKGRRVFLSNKVACVLLASACTDSLLPYKLERLEDIDVRVEL